jgi:hypothetical protein
MVCGFVEATRPSSCLQRVFSAATGGATRRGSATWCRALRTPLRTRQRGRQQPRHNLPEQLVGRTRPLSSAVGTSASSRLRAGFDPPDRADRLRDPRRSRERRRNPRVLACAIRSSGGCGMRESGSHAAKPVGLVNSVVDHKLSICSRPTDRWDSQGAGEARAALREGVRAPRNSIVGVVWMFAT